MDRHDKERVLAEIAGVEVMEQKFDGTLWLFQSDRQWTPYTDHQQAAMVEAGLKKAGFWLSYEYGPYGEYHLWHVLKAGGNDNYPRHGVGKDKDKLTALCECAVEAWQEHPA